MPAKKPMTIDSDSHVFEPLEIWERYLEPEYRVGARSAFSYHPAASGQRILEISEIAKNRGARSVGFENSARNSQTSRNSNQRTLPIGCKRRPGQVIN